MCFCLARVIVIGTKDYKIWRYPTMDYGVGLKWRKWRIITEKMTSSLFLRYFSSDPFHT